MSRCKEKTLAEAGSENTVGGIEKQKNRELKERKYKVNNGAYEKGGARSP